MRRMREPLLWLLLITGTSYAGYRLLGNFGANRTIPPGQEAVATAPSDGEHVKASARGGSVREPDEEDDAEDSGAHRPLAESRMHGRGAHDEEAPAHHVAKAAPAIVKSVLEPAHEVIPPAAPIIEHAAVTPPPEHVALGPDSCDNAERPGAAPQKVKISTEDWDKVMVQFHEVKRKLQAWLDRNRNSFPTEAYASMANELKELRLQRPPSDDALDLAWRGVSIWTRKGTESAMIRTGGGFVELVLQNPQRGKFELARLAAQTWAPCELKHYMEQSRHPASMLGSLNTLLHDPWSPLTSCLGVEDQNACGVGSYSEAGWAVSTVIAKQVADPGCSIPALASASANNCLTAMLSRKPAAEAKHE